MLFAHGGAAGGPNFEALALAIPLVVVGIVLFVQKSAKPVVSVMLVLGGITLGLGGFTFLGGEDDHEEAAASRLPSPRYQTAVAGLCDARAQVADDAVDAAEASFFDDSHVALHDIADRLSERDRAATAELLEAKQAVESGLERAGGGDKGAAAGSVEALQRDLDRLIISTVQGLATLDEEVRGCA